MALTRFQDTEQYAKDIDLFTKRLDELRLAYDQYFVGVIREDPVKLREEVAAMVRKLSGLGLQNARLRFKLQQTIAKYNTYATLWDKNLREIEEGIFKRDLFRMRLHESEKRASKNQKKEEAPAQGEKPAQDAAQPQDPMEKLFQQFIEVKKQCKEPIEGLSLETFKKTITAQVQKMQPQLQGKKLKFQVAAENGKAKIKTFVSK